MARGAEDWMLRLREPDVSDADLARGLKHKSGPVVGAAARTIGEQSRLGFEAGLLAAFRRLLKDPSKRDPGATGKTWIAKAVLSGRDDEILQLGAACVQLDPAWGPPEDVSTELRSLCTLELVARGAREAPAFLAQRLSEAPVICRVAGARGVAAWNDPQLGALLRLHLLRGEDEPEVLSECFDALLELDDDNEAFVLDFLDHEGTESDCALLSLAGSRRIDADRVSRWLDLRVRPERRRVGMIALALLRTDEGREALEHLAQWGSELDQRLAREALDL